MTDLSEFWTQWFPLSFTFSEIYLTERGRKVPISKIGKFIFHPISIPICKVVIWMHGLLGIFYFKMGSNGARIMKFCVFGVHIEFVFFIQFLWGFFLWIYWTVKYGQVCDHQSNIQTDHIHRPEMIMKWHRQYRSHVQY